MAAAERPAGLKAQVAEILDGLRRHDEWEIRNRAAEHFRRLLESHPETCRQRLPLLPDLPLLCAELVALVGDLRSELLHTTCLAIQALARVLGSGLHKAFPELPGALLRSAGQSNAVMRGYAEEAWFCLVQVCPARSVVSELTRELQETKNKWTRIACYESFRRIVESWPAAAVEKLAEPIQRGIQQGLGSADPQGREASARAAWLLRERLGSPAGEAWFNSIASDPRQPQVARLLRRVAQESLNPNPISNSAGVVVADIPSSGRALRAAGTPARRGSVSDLAFGTPQRRGSAVGLAKAGNPAVGLAASRNVVGRLDSGQGPASAAGQDRVGRPVALSRNQSLPPGAARTPLMSRSQSAVSLRQRPGSSSAGSNPVPRRPPEQPPRTPAVPLRPTASAALPATPLERSRPVLSRTVSVGAGRHRSVIPLSTPAAPSASNIPKSSRLPKSTSLTPGVGQAGRPSQARVALGVSMDASTGGAPPASGRRGVSAPGSESADAAAAGPQQQPRLSSSSHARRRSSPQATVFTPMQRERPRSLGSLASPTAETALGAAVAAAVEPPLSTDGSSSLQARLHRNMHLEASSEADLDDQDICDELDSVADTLDARYPQPSPDPGFAGSSSRNSNSKSASGSAVLPSAGVPVPARDCQQQQQCLDPGVLGRPSGRRNSTLRHSRSPSISACVAVDSGVVHSPDILGEVEAELGDRPGEMLVQLPGSAPEEPEASDAADDGPAPADRIEQQSSPESPSVTAQDGGDGNQRCDGNQLPRERLEENKSDDDKSGEAPPPVTLPPTHGGSSEDDSRMPPAEKPERKASVAQINPSPDALRPGVSPKAPPVDPPVGAADTAAAAIDKSGPAAPVGTKVSPKRQISAAASEEAARVRLLDRHSEFVRRTALNLRGFADLLRLGFPNPAVAGEGRGDYPAKLRQALEAQQQALDDIRHSLDEFDALPPPAAASPPGSSPTPLPTARMEFTASSDRPTVGHHI